MRAVKGSLATPLKRGMGNCGLLEGHQCWSCAPGAEEGMEADDLLCSRNARPQKALVGHAQWKISQPPSLKRERASLEGTFLFLPAIRISHRTLMP
jgi:hypothetical protein